MSDSHEHIEEKLIPYLEGVLSLRERRELDEAIGSDGELAREVAGLRQVILSLSNGFAKGAKPQQEELTAEEVVELASGSGGTEAVVGSSEQKAKLFCSDQALEEFSMLRALQEQMARTTLDRDSVPPLPPALREEFAALPKQSPQKAPRAGSVVKLSLWQRASSALDRIDPRPYMASAAALLLLTFGIHLYTRSPVVLTGTSELADSSLAVGSAELAPSDIERAEARAASRAPSGIAVFVSDDRGLLKAQAEKLLARKVPFVLSEDRLLVTEDDLELARAVLWGDDSKLLAASAEPSEQGEEPPEASLSSPEPLDEGSFDEDPGDGPEVTFYDAEGSRPAVASDVIPEAVPPSTGRPAEADESRSSAYTQRPESSVTKAAPPPRPQLIDIPSGGMGSPARSPARSTVDPNDAALSDPPLPQPHRFESAGSPRGESEEARRQRLTDLAAGRTSATPPPARRSAAAPTAPLSETTLAAGTEFSAGDSPVISIEGSTTMSAGDLTLDGQRPAPASSGPPAAANAPPASAESAAAEAQHIASVESKRAGIARQLGVDISLQSEMGRVTVFVRPKGELNEAQRDELRRSIRSALGLKETDSIVLR